MISIEKIAQERIRAETVKSEAEEKIEFLLRYVPKLRMSPRNIVEELEILFVKECYTKGYKIIKEGDFNENVYFVRSGTCCLYHPLNGILAGIKTQLTSDEQGRLKYLALYNLGKIEIL